MKARDKYPTPVLALDAPDVTPAEREAVKRLRNRAGWWEGDANALTVLRAFAAKVRKEKP